MIELRLWSPMPSPVSSPLPQPLWPAKGGAQVWEPGDALVSTTLDPLGSPLAHSGAQACVTLTNRTGFLCQDGSRCISASGVCDSIRTCSHGEDEAEALCREYLLSSAPFQMHPQGSLGGCPLIPSIPVAKLKLIFQFLSLNSLGQPWGGCSPSVGIEREILRRTYMFRCLSWTLGWQPWPWERVKSAGLGY